MEANLTTYVAIEAALCVLKRPVPYGVSHLHQIVEDIPDFLQNLKRYDNTIELNHSCTDE